MARRMREELRFALFELRRFVKAQMREYERIGYPTMSAFAKDIARGTVSLAPLPEDAVLDRVGRFLWRYCNQIERRVAFQEKWTHGFLGMTCQQFSRKREHLLLRLDGYLKASEEI